MPIDIKTFTLIASAICIAILSFCVYGSFYANWGEKHFNMIMKSPFKFMRITNNQSSHALMYKIITTASLILMIFLFLYTLIYK